MDDIITTIAIAFVFIALAVAGLAIGWMITGKSKLKGSCGGKRPNGDGSCGVCGKGKDDDKQC